MRIERFPRSAGMMLAVSLALSLVFPSASFSQTAPAKPLDPIAGIVDAFKTHDVVALGEGNHNNEQGATFRDKLYRDPRFQAAVNDIVVEAGNGRHQAMMDRYISGEDVPEKELRMAWIETTQPNDVWDHDIYADMFRTIREINRKLPKAKQLRVLLGDSPYTYDPANPGAPMMRTDAFPAELVQREVIAKKRKALMIYGDMHYLRRGPQFPADAGAPPFPPSIVGLLEQAGVKVFSVWTFAGGLLSSQDLPALQADIATWPKPTLTLIKDTKIGAAPFTFFYPKGAGRMMRRGPNGPVVLDMGEAIGGMMQEQFDAVLYLGPRSEITFAPLSKSLCTDPDYVNMRAARLSSLPTAPGGPAPVPNTAAGDAFRMRCNEVVSGPRTTPTPGLEALARRILEGQAKGEPPIDIMSPGLLQAAQAQNDSIMKGFARSGPLKSLTFKGSGLGGAGDTYVAVFEYATRDVSISLGVDGKVSGFLMGPFQLQNAEQLKSSFKAIDLNGDGKLDKAEYKTMLDKIGYAQMFDQLFTTIDDNKDGVLTATEYEAHPQ